MIRRSLVATAAALGVVSLTSGLTATAVGAGAPPRHSQGRIIERTAVTHSRFFVGAAKESITPRSLKGIYLGGYGIGPVHPAHAVLRPIYARAIAIRDSAGRQVVIATIDVQGHFIAYQNGPYGFADMAAALHHRLGIPVANMLFQSTHTHNGPDDLGIWGGVPTSYLHRVAVQTERAVRIAVHRERPAELRWATAAMKGFAGTFSSTGDNDDGDVKDFPVDPTLRTLQAMAPGGHVIATLVDFASHATVYGPLDEVSPDWPGATATYLEHDERDMPRHTSYGYRHSVGIVVEGDLGHTWPAGIPRQNRVRLNPPKRRDNNYPADAYGNAIARVAIDALRHHGHPLAGTVAGTATTIRVANDNPVLLAGLVNPRPGLQAYRAYLPPYGGADVLVTKVASLRIGRLLFAGAPGEEYPTINTALSGDVRHATVIPVSLADDQLGYLGTPSDYAAAQECSFTDEGFFTISPLFGNQVLQAQRQDARALGFTVDGSSSLATPGSPPPVNGVCLSQQL